MYKIFNKTSSVMNEIMDESIHLVVTSPPYPMISQWDEMFKTMGMNKDYEVRHDYLLNTWIECYRVLVDGGIMCINIGDATRNINGQFELWPNHATILNKCKWVGFTPLPYILWKKISNKPNAFLGSGFLPPNAYVSQDCEYILIFRKWGLRQFPPKDSARYNSEFTRIERDKWFSQIWNDIPGEKQTVNGKRVGAFPTEIPSRLIRMFSIVGDTVLDPFMGTGTTLVASEIYLRNSIGYEIDKDLCDYADKRIKRLNLIATN
jgi:modification methylase